MKYDLRKIVVIIFLLSFIFYLLSTPAQAEPTRRKGVTVSASIEENRVKLFGYTSPRTRVELSSAKAFAVTYSDDAGYYLFDRTILPKLPGELCLTAIDDSQRRTVPTCIPEPPPVNYLTDIGPVILPPTITIDQDAIRPNSTTIASGQGIPSSPIHIFIYQVSDRAPLFPKEVQAFGLPDFTTVTDASGNYSFNLPTAYSSNYRLYSTVRYQDEPSPKSNTLTYHLPSLFWLFWQQNSWLFFTLPAFVITLSLLFYLLYLYYFHGFRPLLPPAHRYLPVKPRRYLPAVFSYPLQLRYEK